MNVAHSGALRRGNVERINRVADSLRRSPIRAPAIATGHDPQQRARVFSPAPLAADGRSVSGIVIDASIDVCQWVQHELVAGDTAPVHGSLYRLPLPSEVVDEFVVPAYTLQTLADPVQILQEIRRVLKPDVGRLHTWWLVWPTAIDVAPADRVVSVAGLRCTYRLADHVLAIDRDEIARPAPPNRERWTIRADRLNEANATLSEAGFGRPVWLAATPSGFHELTVRRVECHA